LRLRGLLAVLDEAEGLAELLHERGARLVGGLRLRVRPGGPVLAAQVGDHALEDGGVVRQVVAALTGRDGRRRGVSCAGAVLSAVPGTRGRLVALTAVRALVA